MSTRIREEQVDLPSLDSLMNEIAQARGYWPTLKDRLDSLAGGSSHAEGLAIKNAINLAKTNFRLSAHMEATRQKLAGLVVDIFSDTTGIDENLSQWYEYDPDRKEVRASPRVAWEEIDVQDSPPARYSSSLAFDSIRGRAVLFGGRGISGRLNDTWEYDGETWSQVDTPVSPDDRYRHALTFDSLRGKVVLFGGIRTGTLNDTWEYDGTTWVKIETPVSPSARQMHALAFDSFRGRVVLFGGISSAQYVNDTWEYDGTTWTQIQVPASPPARANHCLAFDSKRGKVILFGGYDGTDRFSDTWEYDGTTWTLIETSIAPPPREQHSLTFDTINDKMILFSGIPGSLNDTWVYDGATWKQIETPISPPARHGHSLIFDSVRGKAVMFGGWSGQAGSQMGDTWEFWESSDPSEIVSSLDTLESIPSQVYFVPHIPDDTPTATIDYYLSLDGGENWIPVDPEVLTMIPSDTPVSDPPQIRARALMEPGGSLSGWAYGWV